jgi:hypothetical protein
MGGDPAILLAAMDLPFPIVVLTIFRALLAVMLVARIAHPFNVL